MIVDNMIIRKVAKAMMLLQVICTMGSCEQTVNLDRYKGESTLVLNGLANTDTTIMAAISATWFFTDTQEPDSFQDLSVELYINDQYRGLMSYSDGLYRSNDKPVPGDRVTLRTVADEWELTASDTLPQGVAIDAIDVKKEKVSGQGGVQITPNGNIYFDYDIAYTYSISFSDKTPGRHYYFVSISSPVGTMGMIDYSYDPHFMATAQEINQSFSSLKTVTPYGFPFTNAIDRTDDHTIVIVEQGAPFIYSMAEGRERTFTIFSITEAYYRYLVTLMANSDITWHGDMTEKGLVQPVKVFSNIQGGTGILACTTPTRMKISLQPPFE